MNEQSMDRETREVRGFTRVALGGVGELIVRQGEQESLVIEARAEVREGITSKVRDGTLYLNMEHSWSSWLSRALDGMGTIRYYVTLPRLDGLSLSGAGRIQGDHLTTEMLKVTMTGAGELVVDELTAVALEVSFTSVGRVTVAGKVQTQKVVLSGAGEYNGAGLESAEAAVTLSGAGRALVWATERLDATLSGIGSVEYLGNPQVAQHMSGLGRLKARGER